MIEQDGKVYFSFIVKIKDLSLEHKVLKTYNDFVELE